MTVRKPLPAKPEAPKPLERWNVLGVSDLSEELPPIPWVCEGIGLAPGAVTLVAGYGYSRKTMAMQSLGLSVASGRPAWGLWGVRKGSFLHLDYEQGRRLTQERYQRLARGMGFDLAELGAGPLRVACMPRAYLDEQDVFDELVALVGDAALVLVDSLRAAFPHADENSSEVRTYLDVLSRVSERTGAAIVVIHHARKPNAQNVGTTTHAIRGSSALFDACQSVFVFEGEKDSPTKVHHQKDRVRGVTLPEFGLMSDDVAGAHGLRDGLAVRHLETEQLTAMSSQRGNAREDDAITKVAEKIVTTIGPSEFRGTRADVRAQVRSSTQASSSRFDAAWSRLINEGLLHRAGSVREPVWSLSAPRSPTAPPPLPLPEEERSPLPPPIKGGERSSASTTHEDSPQDEDEEKGGEWWEKD